MNDTAEKYVQEVKRHLKCSRKSRDKRLENLKQAIDDLPMSDTCTYDDCVEQFGKPEDVAAEYLSVMSPQELRYFTRKHKIILGLSLSLVAIIILLIILYFSLVRESPGIIKETGKFEMPNSSNNAVVNVY